MKVKLEDLELLQQYTAEHSEAAFTALVRRHLDLVYSTALRHVRSPQLAEEVAQSVFIDLARSAPRLRPDTVLSAWLYQVAHRTAVISMTTRAETNTVATRDDMLWCGKLRPSWSADAADMLLETTADLSAPTWQTVSTSPSVGTDQVISTSTLGAPGQFFRLRQP